MLAPFRRDRTGNAPSRRRLQYSGPHGRQHAARNAARACAPAREHRRRQRVERRSQTDWNDPARPRAEGFIVWSGDDHLFLPCLALGADGVVGVASHLCSANTARCSTRTETAASEEAAQIHASLLPLIDALFATTSPIPVKWAMRQLGFHVGSCRLPLDEMPAQCRGPFAPAPRGVRVARRRAPVTSLRNSRLPARCRSMPTKRRARILEHAREGSRRADRHARYRDGRLRAA